jgi:hypothetical protein
MANPPQDRDQLDTGVGGFVINPEDVSDPRKAGVYTYDVGDITREGPMGTENPNLPLPLETRGGNVNVDHTPKDLSREVKITIAHYLGNKTKVNYYSIDTDISTERTIRGSEPNTTPHRPNPSQPTLNSSFFTKGKDSTGGVTTLTSARTRDKEQNRGWSGGLGSNETPETVTAEILRKGKTAGQSGTENGNDFLKQVDTDIRNPDPKKISRYQSAVLTNNRFARIQSSDASIDKTFEADGFVKKSSSNNQGVSSTNDTNDQQKQFNPVFYHPKYGEVTAGRLAHLGSLLSLKASGESKDARGAALPGEGSWLEKQLTAQKVNLTNLSLDKIIEELQEDELLDVYYSSISDGSSWGNINNIVNQHSGFSSIGTAVLALAFSAGIGIIIGTFFNLILNNVFDKTKTLPNPTSTLLEKGSSTITGRRPIDNFVNFFSDLLGMKPTVFTYSEAVSKGSAIYFGLDSGQSFSDFLSTSVINTIRASGQIIPVSRAIIRSSVNVYENFANIAEGGLAANGGFTGAEKIKRLLASIESIGESKLMGALNMFATIGDAVLTGEYYSKQLEDRNLQNVTRSTNVHSGRISSNSSKLSWSSNMSGKSVYLLPNNLKDLHTKSGEGSPLEITPDKDVRKLYIRNTKRIPIDSTDLFDPETLTEIESELEAEYVPFYFHDVRTNEVVAFHAFLESLSDDYSASYDSIEGIGRVEPIKIYKGTQRKIGMSFHIVSTSPQDFDDMWEKINKLTTLVYPQYTQGRMHSVGSDYKFTQPFSQLIGASPLIRIRLGNLFRSNYSKFALARLFGADLNETTFGPPQAASEEEKNERKRLQDLFSYNEMIDKNLELRISTKVTEKLQEPGSTLKIRGGFISPSAEKSTLQTIPKKAKPIKGIIDVSQLANSGITCKIISKPTESELEYGVRKIEFIAPLNVKSIKKGNPLYPFVVDSLSDTFLLRNIFDIDVSSLEVPEYDKKRIRDEEEKDFALKKQNIPEVDFEKFQKIEVDKITNLENFLKPENNALVKSFKSSSGKGLAGFIESMSFDWYSNVTWDVDPGRKAPKMCKVTISFSPIHDISPGLDHNGYNRAQIYPVLPKK